MGVCIPNTNHLLQSFPNSTDRLLFLDILHQPAFTEAVFAGRPADAFAATLKRLHEGVMDLEATHALQRTSSHQSTVSVKSQSSQRARTKPRRIASYASSAASSITASDKSLTSFPSFPSFSPEFPRHGSLSGVANDSTSSPPEISAGSISSTVEALTSVSPSQATRTALFEDEPLPTTHVPGAIHRASDEHINRLIARTGAANLLRQIAEDLAQRDAQIAALRRKAEQRERALRRIIHECGLSALDIETRLRAIEDGAKTTEDGTMGAGDGIEHLINDAMHENADVQSFDLFGNDDYATIRARKQSQKSVEDGKPSKNVAKGWKEFIWGSGASKESSRSNSVTGEGVDAIVTPPSSANSKAGTRRNVVLDDVFRPPKTDSLRNASPASSMQTAASNQDRKPMSLATMALKLVAGNNSGTRDNEGALSPRGRSSSTVEGPRPRLPSNSSAKTSASAKVGQPKPSPRKIPTARRTTVATDAAINGMSRAPPQERWDTMGASPQSTPLTENFGPVEMDAIVPLEAQPPTLIVNNNQWNPEFLTDRFGFIYDQRRRKRQKEAAETVRKTKGRSRVEMLSNARGAISPTSVDLVDNEGDLTGLARLKTPPVEEPTDDGKNIKRWQDYLKIATFPTELLSHTPSGNLPTLEVFQGDEHPKSPGITTEGRGFLPPASSPAVPPAITVVSEHATISKPATSHSAHLLAKDDVEPVKLLLEQLSEVHDALQREKTVKWNDFLRKVRAERKREVDAAAAALAAATQSRPHRAMALMPEISLADGEMIGVAGLGNKGKVGRAKWNEFKALVLGGIPVAYRAKIWAECSGATALRVPGYYDDLVASRDGEDDPIIAAQIQMDINRTLTDNIFFRRGPGVAKLNEVLLAYSRRNKEVGYCQGMNLITAYLLLIMPTAEDTFWVLASIIENILPRGYYDHSLLASRADQQVLRQYVSDILPRLSNHLDELGIELEALTFQWFLSVFTDCLSSEALFRVWDIVFCMNDGSTFLFQVALALLKLNEHQLLQCSTPAGVYTYINHQMTNHAISIDGLVYASEGLRKVVKREDVETRREKAIEAEKQLIRQREARNNLRKAERLAALNGANVEAEAVPVPVKNKSQLELGPVETGELVLRTPMPVDEEACLGLG